MVSGEITSNGGIQYVPQLAAVQQIIYLDFDGELTSYNGEILTLDNVEVQDALLTAERINNIVTSLNERYAAQGIQFVTQRPATADYSTIFVGKTTAFDQYGTFKGLAETIDEGNLNKTDKAFVNLDTNATDTEIIATICHETDHLTGTLDHGGDGLQAYAANYDVSSGITSSGITLSWDSMYVSSGGTATATTVNEGGWMYVTSGGTATEIRENGGYVHVADGANVTFVPNTISGLVLSHASATLHSGTTATSTTVNSGGWLEVYDGGTATATTVNSGGWLYVYDGGTATAITADSGARLGFSVAPDSYIQGTYAGSGFEIINGYVFGYTVNPGGSLYVSSGGTATDTTLNSWCNLSVSSGGTANSTTVNFGGSLDVYSSGIANSTTVNSRGGLYVRSGGTANSTTVNSGGGLYVNYDGTATATTVNSGGGLYVNDGGTATATTVNSGGYIFIFSIYSNGIAEDLTLKAGGNLGGFAFTEDKYFAHINGSAQIAPNVSIIDSRMIISSGGTANSTTVNSGGSMYVSSGGTATATTVNYSGSMFVSSGGTATVVFNPWQGTIYSYDGAQVTYLERDANVYYGGSSSGIISKADVMSELQVTSGNSAIIYAGGTATSTTVNSGGGIWIEGGTASALHLTSGGYCGIPSGTVDGVTVDNGGYLNCWGGDITTIEVQSGGQILIQQSASVGYVYASAGARFEFGITTETYVQGTSNHSGFEIKNGVVNNLRLFDYPADKDYDYLTIASGCVAYNTRLFGGHLYVYSGAVARNTIVESGGKLWVCTNDSFASNTVVSSGGTMYLGRTTSGKLVVAHDTLVKSGGYLRIDSGIHRGSLQLEAGAVVSAYEESFIDFTLSDRTTADGYLVNDLSLISGAPTYTITVSANQGYGTYKLAGNAGTFDTTLSLTVGSATYENALQVNGDYSVNGKIYTLAKDDNDGLTLTVSEDEPPALVISGNVSKWTTKDVTLTASATDSDNGVERIEYFDGSEWQTGNTLTVSENGTYLFRATDKGGNVTEQSVVVDKIDKLAPTIEITGNPTSFTNQDVTLTAVTSDEGSGIKLVEYFGIDSWITGDTMTVSQNGTYLFRVTDNVGNVTETSVTVDKIQREATIDKPVISVDILGWTNQNVTVTADFGSDAAGREYSYNGKTWFTYKKGIVFKVVGTIHFRGIDYAGNRTEVTSYRVNNIDVYDPNTPEMLTAATADDTTLLDWKDTRDAGKAGVVGYYVRYGQGDLTGEGTFVESSRFEATSLAVGTWHYQVRSLDAAGNFSDWSDEFTFEVSSKAPTGLTGSAEGWKWEGVAGASGYVVEYSTDDFATVVTLETTACAVDSYALPEGPFKWRVRSDNGSDWAYGEEITSTLSESAKILTSDADGDMDLFFGNATGVWEARYAAQHLGNGTWEGTKEQVLLAGKNKIADIFNGSDDANILVLTDDVNGDALFVDDIYTALGDQARFSQIDEIRAGAGDDIVDMTSERYAYEGNGITVYGGSGNDTLWGGAESNTLFGDGGNDRLVGASGDDVIVGGSGNDAMHGGGGDDIFTFGGAWGCDTVEQLASGSVTLWFAEGSESNWNAETGVYSDGTNTVSVSGCVNVTLRFGADADLPAGAFEEETSRKVFEDKAMLA